MKTKIGFVLGKFMPCHNGHKFLFDSAARLVDKLYILVCTRDCEPINGDLRFNWVQALAPKNAIVIHMHRDIPQEPSENSNFWNIWETAISQYIPESIDVVFGSEQYILKLAEVVKARACIIDLNRSHVDISATKIRESASVYWHLIPNIVKKYYQKRISIIGPQSTGKSTLTQYLSKRLQLDFVNEYGRDYDMLYKKGKNWLPEDFVNIARCHHAIQQEVSLRGSHVIVEDTEIIQTIVWSQVLLGYVPIDLLSMLKHNEKSNHYLLLTPQTKWVDDGTRYLESNAQRLSFYNQLKDILDYFELQYSIIDSDDYESRQKKAYMILLKIK